jgi:hypothetical protein
MTVVVGVTVSSPRSGLTHFDWLTVNLSENGFVGQFLGGGAVVGVWRIALL